MSGVDDNAKKLERETAEKLRLQEVEAARQDNMKRTQAAREAAAQARQIKIQDEINSYGEPMPDEYKSESLLRKVKELSHPSQKTFDNWQSAMMELLGLMKDLVGNLAYERDSKYQKDIYKSVKTNWFKFKELAIQLGHAAADKFTNDADLNIPEMVYDVKLNADEKLEIGALKFANGDPIDPPGTPAGRSPSQSNMKVLVTLWLNTHGYSPSSVEGQYEKPADRAGDPPVILTQAEFEKLRDSRENGLAEYLTKAIGFKHRAEKVEDLGSAPTP